jgi:hypothetical protein
MSAASSRIRWYRLAIPVVSAVALFAMTGTAFANGGGGGGGGGGTANPTLKSITFNPGSVIGGGGETATVTFTSAPSQGAAVKVSSSNPAVAGFGVNTVADGNDVVVLPGHPSATFAVVTQPVTTATQVTVTASAFGTTTVGAILTVEPGTPPAADRVTISKFQWQRGIQTIEATSTNSAAILNVFDQDGTFTGITLTNEGGGKFDDQRSEVFPPDQPIVVESNFGGSATATASISN